MAENGTIVKCRSCWKILDVRPDEPSGQRTPCPSCGSTSRAFDVTVNVGLGLKVSVSGVHYRWFNLEINYVIGNYIIYTVFSFIGLVIGLVIEGGMGGLVGFIISVLFSFLYAFYIDRKVRILMSKFKS